MQRRRGRHEWLPPRRGSDGARWLTAPCLVVGVELEAVYQADQLGRIARVGGVAGPTDLAGKLAGVIANCQGGAVAPVFHEEAAVIDEGLGQIVVCPEGLRPDHVLTIYHF